MSRSDETSGLNDQQRQAVETSRGPLLVLAGAGTGKTRVITARIARLVREGVAAERILAITFTRRAAQEMRQRVRSTLGSAADGLTVCTFHALGFRILRAHSSETRHDAALRVFADDQQRELVSAALYGIRSGDDVDRVLGAISRAKNRGVSPAEYRGSVRNDFQETVARAYNSYQGALAHAGAIDVDDMILQPLKLLEASPDLCAYYQHRWKHLLIDEYQDTNEGQDRLAACLIGEDRNICVVGDDDQSIYSFRGADVERIRTFSTRFAETRTVTLESNYRSRMPIITVASAVISKAERRLPKRLLCQAGDGLPVEIRTFEDRDDEVGFIAEQVRYAARTKPWSSIAVLVRVRMLMGSISHELRLRGIPCVSGNNDTAGVAVMTLHQSKGLEFGVVFLPAMESGVVPHHNAEGDAEALEEERRLCYVGVTRARERLFVTTAKSRDGRPAALSPFLRGLSAGKHLLVR